MFADSVFLLQTTKKSTQISQRIGRESLVACWVIRNTVKVVIDTIYNLIGTGGVNASIRCITTVGMIDCLFGRCTWRLYSCKLLDIYTSIYWVTIVLLSKSIQKDTSGTQLRTV